MNLNWSSSFSKGNYGHTEVIHALRYKVFLFYFFDYIRYKVINPM